MHGPPRHATVMPRPRRGTAVLLRNVIGTRRSERLRNSRSWRRAVSPRTRRPAAWSPRTMSRDRRRRRSSSAHSRAARRPAWRGRRPSPPSSAAAGFHRDRVHRTGAGEGSTRRRIRSRRCSLDCGVALPSSRHEGSVAPASVPFRTRNMSNPRADVHASHEESAEQGSGLMIGVGSAQIRSVPVSGLEDAPLRASSSLFELNFPGSACTCRGPGDAGQRVRVCHFPGPLKSSSVSPPVTSPRLPVDVRAFGCSPVPMSFQVTFPSSLRLDVSHDGWPSVRTSPPSPDVRRPVDRSQRQPDRPPNFRPARDSTVVSALPPDGVPRERSGIPLEGRTSRRRQCGVARGARRRLRFPLRCLGSDRRSHRTSRVTFGEVCPRKKEMQKGEALPDRRLTY